MHSVTQQTNEYQREYADYYKVIKRPVALDTIQVYYMQMSPLTSTN